MNLKQDEIISDLRQKIKSLISLYEDQKSVSIELHGKNKALGEQVEMLENKLSNLEKKYENLKIAKALSSIPGEGIHDTKLQVNKIVREIDKCIALLNR
jgi:hypothetical protein